MKKVTFLIGTLSNGGAERTVSNISLKLSNSYNIDIVLYGNKSKIEYPYGGNILKIDELHLGNFIRKFIVLAKRVNKIKKLKSANRNESVVSFLSYPNLLNLLTSSYGRTIISVRNHISTQFKKGLKGLLWRLSIKIFYGRADKIIVVSEEIRNDLTKNFNIDPSKIEVIYNSYPIEDIKLLAKEHINEDHENIFQYPVIITVGRLNKQKGHWHLIRAFSKVKESVVNAKLVILGDGELNEELIRIATDLNVINDVHFLGFQENPFKYVSRSKLFVLSSLHEGFPNALAEAMICGVPVISTDCLSGPKEILDPGHGEIKGISYDEEKRKFGILVPVFDGNMYGASEKLTPEENIIADKMCELLKNDELRSYYAMRSIERSNDFNIENIIKQWERLM